MAISAAEIASTTWAVASGLAIAVLGWISLRGGPTRPRGALAFGLFALSWAGQIAAGNLMTVATSETVIRWLALAFLAFQMPVAYFLVEFAVAQGDAGRWGFVARALAAASALAAVIIFLVDPQLLLYGVTTNAGRAFPVFGALYPTLPLLPQFLAFAFALYALQRGVRKAATPRIGVRMMTLLLGLGIYAGFASSNNITFFLIYGRIYGPLRDALLLSSFVALAAVTALVAILAYTDSRKTRSTSERRGHAIIALAIGTSLVWGAVEGGVSAINFPRLNTVGLWRLLGVGIIAYGLARWRLFDLPQRAMRTAATAAGGSASLATGAATFGAFTLITTGIAAPAIAGITVVAATLLPGTKLARRLFAKLVREPEGNLEDHRYGQRIEAYRAALESAVARGMPEEETSFLEALRERFGISEAEDKLLRHYARSAVLIPRERDATAAYERLRLLGEGGAGRTWLARDRIRDRLIVLKEPLAHWQREPQLRETVLREARLAARVRHPHVITVEEVIEDKGMPIIVMEHMEGGSLADSLRARGIMPWRDATEMVVQIARGVEAVHSNGIIHRDIKPSNILLDGDGVPKVADFGIAMPASDKTAVESSSSFTGTYAYVAPEVRTGQSGDRRSDVYSLASILHECLFGSPPGPRSPVLAANDVPAALSASLARALADEPNARPASARAWADELMTVMRT